MADKKTLGEELVDRTYEIAKVIGKDTVTYELMALQITKSIPIALEGISEGISAVNALLMEDIVSRNIKNKDINVEEAVNELGGLNSYNEIINEITNKLVDKNSLVYGLLTAVEQIMFHETGEQLIRKSLTDKEKEEIKEVYTKLEEEYKSKAGIFDDGYDSMLGVETKDNNSGEKVRISDIIDTESFNKAKEEVLKAYRTEYKKIVVLKGKSGTPLAPLARAVGEEMGKDVVVINLIESRQMAESYNIVANKIKEVSQNGGIVTLVYNNMYNNPKRATLCNIVTAIGFMKAKVMLVCNEEDIISLENTVDSFRVYSEIINVPEVGKEETYEVCKRLYSLNKKEENTDKENDNIRKVIDMVEGLDVKVVNPGRAYTIIGRLDKEMLKGELDEKRVAEEVEKAFGIKYTKVKKDVDLDKLRSLGNTLKETIIGQDEAIEEVVKVVQKAEIGISNPDKPKATMMFIGSTGVGKTELCRQLADKLGKKDEFIKIDMSEYSEPHSVSKLFGTAPGYVGYDEGGQLTNAIKKNPNSIVVFDEIEKANSKVFDSLLQVMEDGVMTDGSGNKVSFKDSIIIMTSNIGSSEINREGIKVGFGSVEDTDEQIVDKELEGTFRLEFLNRIDKKIVFKRITKEDSRNIAKNIVSNLEKRLNDRGYNVSFDNGVIDFVTENGYSEKYGARNIRKEVDNDLSNLVVDRILDGEIKVGEEYTFRM